MRKYAPDLSESSKTIVYNVTIRLPAPSIHLILEMDFVPPPTNKTNEHLIPPTKQELLNVYTSPTQPPSIRRGGSSSAVNRNLMRQSISQESNVHPSIIDIGISFAHRIRHIKNQLQLHRVDTDEQANEHRQFTSRTGMDEFFPRRCRYGI